MKKILFIIITILLLVPSIVISADGIFPEHLNVTLNNATWVEIAISGSSETGSVFLFHTRAGEDFQTKKTATSTDEFTFKDGEAGSVSFGRDYQDVTLFWAKLVSAASDTLEVFIYKQ